MTDTWTPERTKTLTALWAAGLSCRQIMSELGLESRNQVVGKVFRLQLPPPEKKQYTETRGRPRKDSKKTLFQMFVKRPLDDHADKALHIAFLDLQPIHCRFPYGDGPFTFCGHPKTDGSSYCADHRSFTCQVVMK